MRKIRQIQEAKDRFSEVADRALREGPQADSCHGKKTVVAMSSGDYDRITRGTNSVVEFLRKSPLRRLELDRSRDLPREVML